MSAKKHVFSILIVACICSMILACHRDYTPGSFYPAVAYDETNRRYLAVFAKQKSGDFYNRQSHLTGVFIDSAGGPLGEEFVIIDSDTEIICPTLVYDNLHARFLVVWNETTNMYAQSINADGSLNGPRLTLSDTAEPPTVRCSALAFDHVQGAFLAAWGEKNRLEHDSLFTRLIAADGSLSGPKTLVSDDGGTPAWPSVAYDGANQRYLTVWDNAGNHEIKGRFINPDGTVDAPQFSISSVGGTEYWPKASYDSVNSRFLITWEHSNTGTYSLLGQLWNTDGTPNQSVFTISSTGVNVFRHTTVFDPAGRQYFVLFGDFNIDHQQIHAQIVPPDGVLANGAINNTLLSYQDFSGDRRPTVAYDSLNQRYFATWSYGSDDQQFSDIHGRHVNSDGTPSGQIYVLSNGGVWP